jgi:hypothetical protein
LAISEEINFVPVSRLRGRARHLREYRRDAAVRWRKNRRRGCDEIQWWVSALYG